MKRICIAIIFLLACFHAYPVYFKHIGMQEGLSQLSVMSIYQDKLGRMWFGTLEGITMFDGNRTTAFKHSGNTGENIIGNENYSITGDEEGNIYFVSDRSLIMFDIRLQKFIRLTDSNTHRIDQGNGSILVGAGDTIYTLEPNKELLYYACLEIPGIQIQKLLTDSEDRLWAGTNSGLYLRNETGAFEVVLPLEDIYAIFEDSRKTLWVSTRYQGIYKKEKDGGFVYYSHFPFASNGLSSAQIRCFIEDNYNNIWMGAFSGLVKYNPNTGQTTVYAKDDLPGSLKHSSVFSLYKDRQGSIWAGTYYGGVSYFNPEKDIFTLYPSNPMRDDCVSFPFVGHMAEDKDNNVWICTEGGGLNFFDRETHKFTHYKADGKKNSIPHNNLKSICYSPKRNELYIGTHTGGLSIFDITKKQFRNIMEEKSNFKEMAGGIVNHVRLYKDKYLVILTHKGFFRYDLDSGELSPLFDRHIPFYYSFTIDSEGFIWIPSNAYLIRIDLEGKAKDEIFSYGENGLDNYDINQVFEDRRGRLFASSKNSGLFLFDKTERTFSRILPGNTDLEGICYEVGQSLSGYIIVSNSKGIVFIHPELKESKLIELGSALPLSGINKGCGLLVCRNGEIFIGGIDGVASFFEQDIFSSTKDYRLYFSDLYINSESVRPGSEDGVLSESLPFTKQIKLKHNQNNITLTFTSNNYISKITKTVYEYKLEGFDDKWITVNSQNISYTNLNPGKYTLFVQEKEPDPLKVSRNIQLAITIRPPVYATPLAYLLYAAFVLGIIYGVYRFKRTRLLLQASLELERKEKEKIEEINNAKLQFFSNISHEFRTPLTLIITQLDLLLQSTSLAPLVYNKLLKVYNNTHHLRNLINELLDFRKLEQGHVRLKVQEQDIVSFVKEIYLSFYEYALSQSVTYKFTAPGEAIQCWFDPKQMGKVFYNLLSNAFKYTKGNATVEVVVESSADGIQIKIIDNGIGIDKEHINRIFDRFYQIDNNPKNHTSFPSTGIGLSLTKSLVEMHHGTIRVESTPGYGSIFIVHLLKGNSHFKPEEMLAGEAGEAGLQQPKGASPAMQEEEADALPDQEHHTYKALIVEDNEDILQTLKALFSQIYNVTLARNGKEGLELAREERPDIIVSDVMMPEMSGIEMCIKIKSDFDVCHIPVVLLTALTSVEQNVEGLQRGADDYISKPFNAKILLARCNNLVRNRIILQKKFSLQTDFDTQALASNPIDQRFLNTINRIIENNLDNEAFGMNEMAKDLALSRSSLYAKFKALTGITPNEYVLNARLNKAATMLTEEPETQIAEIASSFGFTPRYFTRCFKAKYNVTPAEYRSRKQ